MLKLGQAIPKYREEIGMKLKKILAVSLAFAMAFAMIASVTGCAPKTPAVTTPPAATGNKAAGAYIALIAKGFQFQYWQVVMKGAEQAATDLGVTITFDGPPSESDISTQVDMLNSVIAKKPAAIGLAALDTTSVLDQLNACKSANIPVVGFDSGVPNAPAGSIYATASTDNYAAAGIAAEHLFNNAAFQTALKSGKHITVGVLSQDATSESITKRTSGFIDALATKVEAVDGFAGAVEVVGHDKYKKAASATAKLTIKVNIPATTGTADMTTGAGVLLGTPGLVGIFCSNEGAVTGLLAASSDGQDFNKTNGKYKNIIAMGFDAGKPQKVAVQNGWFYGSITQDPYTIGYKTVSLAVDAINGKPAASPIIDTGAKWYDATLMKDPSILQLLYD
jgi:ribose transport system substrate-binding protein